MNPTQFLEPFSAVASQVVAALLNTMLAASAVAALAWVTMRCLPRVNAATRYAAWWAVLAAIVVLAAMPFLPQRAAAPAMTALAVPVEEVSVEPVPMAAAPAVAAPIQPVEVESGLWILGVFGVWALACLWRIARIGRSYFVLRGLRRRARLAPPEIASVFDRRRLECGIERPARLLISAEVAAPIAMGFRWPAVLLPASLLAEISPDELDHVLLHELAHVARYDDWTNLVARAANAALGLHPVIAFVISRIDRERENACDDWVVARTGAARPYAASLTRIFELTHGELTHAHKPLLASGMAERGSKLGARVERLLERGREFSAGVSVEMLAVSAAMLVGLVFTASHAPNWIAFAQDRISPPIELRDLPLTQSDNLLAQLAYFQRAPVPPTAPQAPAPAAAPVPAVPPAPPRPPEVEGTWRELFARDAQTEAIRAQLRETERQLRDNNTPEARAQLSQAQAELQRALSQIQPRRIAPFHKPLLEELIDAGMTNLSVDEIIQMAQNGVSPQYMKALGELGWNNLTRDQIVAFQQNGVSAAYLRELKEAGITDLSPDQVIAASQNGVRGRDIQTARKYKRDMNLNDIIKLKQNGAL